MLIIKIITRIHTHTYIYFQYMPTMKKNALADAGF